MRVLGKGQASLEGAEAHVDAEVGAYRNTTRKSKPCVKHLY